jgi:hypothetical protein
MMVGWKADFLIVMIMIISTSTNRDRLRVWKVKRNSTVVRQEGRGICMRIHVGSTDLF